ncbi:MAG: hypothetical protein R2849_21040 [Thermomicrobiales bacterium]
MILTLAACGDDDDDPTATATTGSSAAATATTENTEPATAGTADDQSDAVETAADRVMDAIQAHDRDRLHDATGDQARDRLQDQDFEHLARCVPDGASMTSGAGPSRSTATRQPWSIRLKSRPPRARHRPSSKRCRSSERTTEAGC